MSSVRRWRWRTRSAHHRHAQHSGAAAATCPSLVALPQPLPISRTRWHSRLALLPAGIHPPTHALLQCLARSLARRLVLICRCHAL